MLVHSLVRFVAILTVCFVFACSVLAEGSRVSGRVVDQETGRPLESVNIFLSGTTRGTVTNANGEYVLSEVPLGFYHLVASRVGSAVAVVSLEVKGQDVVLQDIALEQRVVSAQEVEVLGERDIQWQSDLKEFEREFLGTNWCAEQARILNPEVLAFTRDPETGRFHASTDSLLRVESAALGYLLVIALRSFTWDPSGGTLDYTAYVRFESLLGRPGVDSSLVEENRERAYRGSLRHFLRAIVRHTLETQGFYVYNTAGESMGSDARRVVLTLPDGLRQLATDGVLRIDYGGATRMRRNHVRLAQGLVHLRPDGSLVEQQDFLIDPSSDWAQLRVGTMLPLEYDLR